MNQLIILCNPKEDSFCEALAHRAEKTSKKKGIQTILHNIYKIKFNPVLSSEDLLAFEKKNFPIDIKKEHELITWADILTFIFPIYWAGMPALMKGYIERVICKNFAYCYTDYGIKGLLTNKKAILLNPFGNTNEYYEVSDMFKALNRTIDKGIFQFCGIKILDHRYFGSIHKTDQNIRKSYLKEVEEIIDRLL